MANCWGGGGTVWGQCSRLVRIVGPASLVETANRIPGDSKLPRILAGPGVCRLPYSLKLLYRVADNSFVQRSALLTAVSLVLGGVTLAGIGERAGGRFEAAKSDSGAPTALADSSGHGDNRVAAGVLAFPALPEAGDYLPAGRPGYTLRRNVPEVRLQFTVADEQGRPVPNLSSGDVRILDDQLPVTRLNAFERDDNLPLRLGLVLDTSDSVQRVLSVEKAVALDFLKRVMRPETDQAFIMGFGGDVRVWHASTAHRPELVAAISHIQQPGWGTRFFDAVYSACADQLSTQPDMPQAHRAIIVLSDGDDTESFRALEDVIAIAQRNEIQIYALSLRPRKSTNPGDQVLQRMADATGGRIYIARSNKELERAFIQIEQELRTQYYVSFSPQAAPGFHSLRVVVPAKLQVHARQGYYASAQ